MAKGSDSRKKCPYVVKSEACNLSSAWGHVGQSLMGNISFTIVLPTFKTGPLSK